MPEISRPTAWIILRARRTQRSWKDNFLDVVALMSDLMSGRGDVAAAVQLRSATFEQLLWRGEGASAV